MSILIKKIEKLNNVELLRLQDELAAALIDLSSGKPTDKITLNLYSTKIKEEVERRINLFLKCIMYSHKNMINNLKKDLSYEPQKFGLELMALDRLIPEPKQEHVQIEKRVFKFVHNSSLK